MASIISRARNSISADAHKIVGNARRHIDSAKTQIIQDARNVENKIEHAETAVSTAGHNAVEGIEHGISSAAKEIKSDISNVVQAVPSALSSAGGYIENAVLSAGDTLSGLEDKLLPSPTAIITETGLVVGAIAIIGLIALKFV